MKKTALRVQRIFSEDLRKEVVNRIECGHLSVTKATREYGVSVACIYKWLNNSVLNDKKSGRQF